MEPSVFFKALADDTRLCCLLLIQQQGELCVCELTAALAESQPKVSRHLAQLRTQGILQDRRQGQWVFYRFDDALPQWCRQVLAATLAENHGQLAAAVARLHAMQWRPARCCDAGVRASCDAK
ncbi:metalloregulator ArsR/SmtB family transcription factor [Shewanella sp. YIC-542]|uniref:metalloregulator ArsR/SmtB family transcription factor n=1 Tax=Shewanella mytili TaxID=3377111 RepID=UPI00398EBE37